MGVGLGDRVGILAENRHEWLTADLAVLSAGAVDVPMHAALAPAQVQYQLAHSGARGVIVKLGAAGAYYRTADAEGVVPAQPVAKVVDTVGAGDGFAVGVVSALLEGRALADAVARGHRIGALAIQVIGDSEGLPTRAELNALEQQPNPPSDDTTNDATNHTTSNSAAPPSALIGTATPVHPLNQMPASTIPNA